MPEDFEQPTQSHLKNSNWESVIESLPQPKAGRETPTVPNGTGANVILCSEDGFKVTVHEVLVRNCTKIFRLCSNISNFDQLRDKNDFLCFVLQGASEEMLRGLSDFLYTGSCQGLSHNEKKNILGLLDNKKCVETSVQLFNKVVEIKDEFPLDLEIKEEEDDLDLGMLEELTGETMSKEQIERRSQGCKEKDPVLDESVAGPIYHDPASKIVLNQDDSMGRHDKENLEKSGCKRPTEENFHDHANKKMRPATHLVQPALQAEPEDRHLGIKLADYSIRIANRQDFKTVMKRSNEEGEPVYFCPYCQFQSKLLVNAHRHIDQQHQGMKWFRCPIQECGITFLLKEGDVETHKDSHANFPDVPLAQCVVRDDEDIDRLRALYFIPEGEKNQTTMPA